MFMSYDNYRVIRRREVEAKTGLCRSSIYQKISKGEFPAQIALGARSVGWIESDVNDWIGTQIERSRGGLQ
jgi:prophage regulatory protein